MEEESETVEKPKNKGGRPRGSKTRPKWLRNAPKRPRGRPKGSKNKPKTLQGFIRESLSVNADPPPRPPPKPKDPRFVANAKANFHSGTKEQISKRAKKANRARIRQGKVIVNFCPPGWTNREYLPLYEEAKKEAKRLVKHMIEDGKLPSDDDIGNELMASLLTLVRAPGGPAFKLKAIKTALDFVKARPTQKTEVTVKTAEDFLDELAAHMEDKDD